MPSAAAVQTCGNDLVGAHLDRAGVRRAHELLETSAAKDKLVLVP